jgi:predicted peptidase
MHFPVPKRFQPLTAFFSNSQKWIYSILEPNSSYYGLKESNQREHDQAVKKTPNGPLHPVNVMNQSCENYYLYKCINEFFRQNTQQ